MCSLTVQMRMMIMKVVTTDAVGIWGLHSYVKSFGNDINILCYSCVVLMWPLALASAVWGLALLARASPPGLWPQAPD